MESVAISEEGTIDWRAVVVVPPMEVEMVISVQVPTVVAFEGESREEQAVVFEEAAEA